MDQEDQILTELSSLDDLLLPLSRSARLKYNCMSISTRFIALGSNTGGVYLFSRETCNFLQVVFAEKETSPIIMASLSPNDKYVAMAGSSGILHVIDLKVESRAKPETLRSTSDWNGALTYVHWDTTCTRLYYGDSMGGVYEMTVHSSKAKNLFTLPPEPILKLDSSIVQIDKAGEKLLVSTMTRCYLCDTNRQQFSTIGKKLRDGQFGACFLCQASSPTIYCARPGSRMWEVDIEGDVMNTHQFKQLLAIPPLPAVRLKEPLQLPGGDGKFSPQSLNFPKLKVVSGSYILTWTDNSVYILDPVNIKVVLWSQPFTGIQDVYCLNNEIFLFLSSMQVHCLSLLPVSRVTSLCFLSEAYINAASLCIHFENSFCLKRKTNFDRNSMKMLYDTLVKTEMSELAENLHSVIVNTERKLAALSDSESTGSNKSRTNSFIEKDTAEKAPGHQIENRAIGNHGIVNDSNLEDDGSLELFVNQSEDIRTTTIDAKLADVQNTKKDVTAEDNEPELVAFSNINELDNAKSANNKKDDIGDSKNEIGDSVQDDQQVLCIESRKNENKVNSHDVTEIKPAYKSSVPPEENLERQNNLLNSLTRDEKLERSEKIICDVESSHKSLEVNREIDGTENQETNGIENQFPFQYVGQNVKSNENISAKAAASDYKTLMDSRKSYPGGEGITLIHSLETGRDLAKAHRTSEAETKKNNGDNLCVNGDEDVCSLFATKDNIETVIETKTDKHQAEIETGSVHSENMRTTEVETLANRTSEDISVNDDQSSESVLDTKVSHVSVIDTDLIKTQSKSETANICHENTIKLDVVTTADVDLSVARSKSPTDAEHSFIRSKSPAPSTSSQKSTSSKKSGELGDILEDDFDLIQNRSSNMGSRRQSLTSLSSLSSAEVVLEQVSGNFPEEIAVPVKRKSSKRKQRRSLEGSGEAKKKGVKINRSFSLGAIQTHGGKDFSISPQGSLDHTIEEDCFTSVSLESDRTQQQTVSQSVPTSTEEHSRSLPNMGEFENETPNVPVLDLRATEDTSVKESVFLSLSAEFSKSDELTRSGEFSESSLLRSFEGTREGLSSSPKTALKHLKDRVQKNLKSQTKKVITNIKDKHLLSRAKEFLSQPKDVIEHQKSEFFIQSQEYEVQSASKEETRVDETDSIPKCPVDITALQDITAETQKKLEDPSVLLNPDTVYKVLLDWVTVLNRTFHELHLAKYTQSALIHSEAVSGQVFSDSDKMRTNKTLDNWKSTQTVETKADPIELTKENSSKSDTSESFGRENESKIVGTGKSEKIKSADTLKHGEPGASILSDKDFCYTKDPLFLPVDVFSNVSELALACFDIGCHGNILQYQDLQVSQNEGKIDTLKSSKKYEETVSELSNNLTDKTDTGTKYYCEVQGHSSEDAQHSKGQGCQRKGGSLPGDASKNICDTNLETANGSKLNETALMCSENNVSVSDNSVQQETTADKIGYALTQSDLTSSVHESNMRENKSFDLCPDVISEVKGEGHYHSNSSFGDEVDDEGTAFFVRCYFPYLSAIKIRNKTKEHGKCWYQTWCALVLCLQELACEDSERFGVDRDALLRHMIESPREDGYILLGHVSMHELMVKQVLTTRPSMFILNQIFIKLADNQDRHELSDEFKIVEKKSIFNKSIFDLLRMLALRLFTIKSSSLVSACAKCQPYIQPLDVLYMCKLHTVAIETTFKSYMQQMIQDATRTHRKDTISALYSHPEVKRVWLDILLAEEGNTQEMIDSNGNPCVLSHCHIWKNQPAIDTIVSQTDVPEDRNMVLELCSKYGYWNGCLKILKYLGESDKQTDIILHLGDVRLFNARSFEGYLPSSVDEWKQLLQAYKDYSNKSSTEAGSQSDVMPSSDWSDRITWNSLGSLLIRHLGPSQAVTLLQEMDIPESSLTASFYQTCAMAGLVHRHQRLVLHSMLEKIDTYLWAQRPVYSSPQLHYIVVKERELQSKGSNSAQQEHLQKLIQQMKTDEDQLQSHYAEDPDCHWGVETKINLICPCCNIPLKETVSHVEPGIFLFKCGHGYHRMCLPERDCFLCLDDTAYTVQKAFI